MASLQPPASLEQSTMENSWGRALSIPEEIIFEIFSWLPVKSLMCFKCVSKFCNSLVSESDFINIHRCHSMTRPGGTKFFIHEWKSGFYTADQKEDSAFLFQAERFIEHYGHVPRLSLLDCVNGLFLIRGPLSMGPPAIFNPSSRVVRLFPKIKINELSDPYNYSFGFEPEEKKFKVLSAAMDVREKYVKHWVFTLDESWRETQSIPTDTSYCKPTVCISGVIYQYVKSDDKDAIAAFDLKSEKLEIIALWPNASDLLYYYELIEVKGKLAVIDYERWLSGCIDLWILEQTPRKEWERHNIEVPSLWTAIEPRFASSCMARDWEIIVFVLYSKSNAYLCYNVTRKSWRELKFKGLPEESLIKGIYSYVESLVPFG